MVLQSKQRKEENRKIGKVVVLEAIAAGENVFLNHNATAYVYNVHAQNAHRGVRTTPWIG